MIKGQIGVIVMNKIDISNKHVSLMDGFAIIFILLSHAGIGKFHLLGDYPFANFGLILFTFSSGFKLVFNHFPELMDRKFLRTYLLKRFVRLYKPYVGYTLLSLPVVLMAALLRKNLIFLKDFVGLRSFDENSFSDLLYKFLIGDNPIAHHLWYLFTLLIVTIICFGMLYGFCVCMSFKNILSRVSVGIGFYSLIVILTVFLNYLLPQSPFYYIVIYIAGLLFAYIYLLNKRVYFLLIYILSLIFIITYIFSLEAKIRFLPFYLMYGLTFPSIIMVLCIYLYKSAIISNKVSYCGMHSFHIYLLHEPIIEPVIMLLFVKSLDISNNVVVPLVVVITIFLTIVMYSFLNYFNINRLFE